MSPRDIVPAWVEAFNRGDAEKLAAFYTETATNHQVANELIVGRTAIREMFQREFSAATMCASSRIYLKMANGPPRMA